MCSVNVRYFEQWDEDYGEVGAFSGRDNCPGIGLTICSALKYSGMSCI